MAFSKMDKALLDRAARNLTAQAREIELAVAVPMGWGASKESKVGKLGYDRLLRDARDLRALAKRSMPANITPQLPLHE